MGCSNEFAPSKLYLERNLLYACAHLEQEGIRMFIIKTRPASFNFKFIYYHPHIATSKQIHFSKNYFIFINYIKT